MVVQTRLSLVAKTLALRACTADFAARSLPWISLIAWRLLRHLALRPTLSQEVAQIAIRQHAASGFQGEHADAYETGTIMGFLLLLTVLGGVGGCFLVHLQHTKPKSDEASLPPTGKASKGAVAPASAKLKGGGGGGGEEEVRAEAAQGSDCVGCEPVSE